MSSVKEEQSLRMTLKVSGISNSIYDNAFTETRLSENNPFFKKSSLDLVLASINDNSQRMWRQRQPILIIF